MSNGIFCDGWYVVAIKVGLT